MNRVKKVSRKWEEARDGSLAVLASNKAATKRRKLRYATHGVRATGTVEPVGVVVSAPVEPAMEAGTEPVPVDVVQDGVEAVQVPLTECTVHSLRMMCVSLGLKGYSKATKARLIEMLEAAGLDDGRNE